MAEVYVSTDVEADGPIPGPHTHQALDDALEQGALFLAMLAERPKPGSL